MATLTPADILAQFRSRHPTSTVLYVKPVTGNNANDGSTANLAKKDLQNAIDASSAGTEIRIVESGGDVTGDADAYSRVTFNNKSGNASAWITIVHDPGIVYSATLTGATSTFKIRGKNKAGLMFRGGSHHVAVYGVEFYGSATLYDDGTDAYRKGIQLCANSHHVHIWNCYLHDLASTGISINDGQDAGSGGGCNLDVGFCAITRTSKHDPYNTSGIGINDTGDNAAFVADADGYHNHIFSNTIWDIKVDPSHWFNENAVTDGNGVIFDLNTQAHGSTWSSLCFRNVVTTCGGRGLHSLQTSNVYYYHNTVVRNLRANENRRSGDTSRDDMDSEGELHLQCSTGDAKWNVVAPHPTGWGSGSTNHRRPWWQDYGHGTHTVDGNVVLANPNGPTITGGNLDRTATGLAYFQSHNDPIGAAVNVAGFRPASGTIERVAADATLAQHWGWCPGPDLVKPDTNLWARGALDLSTAGPMKAHKCIYFSHFFTSTGFISNADIATRASHGFYGGRFSYAYNAPFDPIGHPNYNDLASNTSVSRLKTQGKHPIESYWGVRAATEYNSYGRVLGTRWFSDSDWTTAIADQVARADEMETLGGHGIWYDPELFSVPNRDQLFSYGNTDMFEAGDLSRPFSEKRDKVLQRGAELGQALGQAFPGIRVVWYFSHANLPEVLQDFTYYSIRPNHFGFADWDTSTNAQTLYPFIVGMVKGLGTNNGQLYIADWYHYTPSSLPKRDNAMQYGAYATMATLSQGVVAAYGQTVWGQVSDKVHYSPFLFLDGDPVTAPLTETQTREMYLSARDHGMDQRFFCFFLHPGGGGGGQWDQWGISGTDYLARVDDMQQADNIASSGDPAPTIGITSAAPYTGTVTGQATGRRGVRRVYYTADGGATKLAAKLVLRNATTGQTASPATVDLTSSLMALRVDWTITGVTGNGVFVVEDAHGATAQANTGGGGGGNSALVVRKLAAGYSGWNRWY